MRCGTCVGGQGGRGSAIIMRRLFKEISRNNNVGWQLRKLTLVWVIIKLGAVLNKYQINTK